MPLRSRKQSKFKRTVISEDFILREFTDTD